MKRLLWVLTLALFLATGCASSRKVIYQDDAYYSLDDAELEAKQNKRAKDEAALKLRESQENTTTTDNAAGYTTDKNGDLVLRNDYYSSSSDFEYDDYYDYSYSSRLRRFHGNGSWNYYDPYYTNTYWYTYNPNYFGTSVYTTYVFYYPSYHNYGWSSWGYNPWSYNSWNWGYSYGYGNWYNPWCNSWYSNNWWNPYNNWCYGWNYSPYPGCYGNNYGYWNGFYNGVTWGNTYYNSYDFNTYSYGPRTFNTDIKPGNVSFSQLMSQNGISMDVKDRTPIIIPGVATINNRVDEKPIVVNGNIQTNAVSEPGLDMTTTRSNTTAEPGTINLTEGGPTRDGSTNTTSGTSNITPQTMELPTKQDTYTNNNSGTNSGTIILNGTVQENSSNASTNSGTKSGTSGNTWNAGTSTGTSKTYDESETRQWDWGSYNSGSNSGGTYQKSGSFGEGSRSPGSGTFTPGGSGTFNSGGSGTFNSGSSGGTFNSGSTPSRSGSGTGGGGVIIRSR